MGARVRSSRQWRLYALVAVLVVIIAVLVATMLGNQSSGTDRSKAQSRDASASTTAPSSSASPLDDLARRQQGDPLALGEPDAPVVMVAYEDFRCPFCAKFATEVAPELRKRYVEAGKLRIEWRDFPIFGEQSMLAAKAGRAAARQDMFWRFQGAVFADAPSSGHPTMNESKLVSFAKEAGVPDISLFKKDMTDPAIAEAIREDMGQARRIGARSTPSFVINGKPVVGAQPQRVFVKAIEQALAQQR